MRCLATSGNSRENHLSERVAVRSRFFIVTSYSRRKSGSLAASMILAQSLGDMIPPSLVKGTAKSSVQGLTPSQTRQAYGFDNVKNGGAGQLVAIVEAFSSPKTEEDLAVFNSTFGLPPCSTN